MSDEDPTLRVKPFTLTPNDIARVEACPAARVYVGPRDGPSHAMWHGIAIHRFIEYAKTRGRDAALAYIAKKFKGKLAICERIDVDSIPDGDIEPQYVIDIEHEAATAVYDHKDADPDEHVYMRGDLVWDDGRHVSVADYKTGDPSKQTMKAGDNVQLLTIATAVWLERARKPKVVRGELVSISSDGVIHWGKNAAHFTATELADHLRRLRRVHLLTLETRAELREEGAEPEFVPGPHCYGCRARLVCPSVSEVAK